MSYSFSAEVPKDEAGMEALETAAKMWRESTTAPQPETAEAIHLAIRTAFGVVSSGVLGDGPFHVSIAGHANTEHQPPPGWAPDLMTITVASMPR